MDYIKEKESISVEEVMNNYDKSLPLRNRIAEQIIDLLRNGYISKQKGQNADTRRTPEDKREVGRIVPQIYAEGVEKSSTLRPARRENIGGREDIASQVQTLSTAESEEYVNEVAKSLPEGVKVVVTNSAESGDREHTGWYDK